MKTKLTPELTNRILDLLSQGHFVECICPAVGIGTSTFYRWLEQGEKQKKGIFRDFREAVKHTKAVTEVVIIDRIQKSDDWRAAAWLAERLYPERWGRKRIEISGPDGGPVPFSQMAPPDEPLRVYIMPTPDPETEEAA